MGTGVQRNFQGTGLGLAICEKLISMMDGDISVDSGGMGSQFTLRIPLYGAQYPVKKERGRTRRNLLLAGGAQYFFVPVY